MSIDLFSMNSNISISFVIYTKAEVARIAIASIRRSADELC
ncbi:hypothetical protein Z949_1799 [Sulfitobacter guttiformis KCTC 32187]|nr:hypothetical protein Z949_1799 [Sulfitobacter guttiformis KCTC 32187]